MEHAENAIRLNPLDPDMPIFVERHRSRALCAGRYLEAARYAEEQLQLRQTVSRRATPALPASPYGLVDEAREFLAGANGQPQLDPAGSASVLSDLELMNGSWTACGRRGLPE